MSRTGWWLPRLTHPAQVVVTSFATVVTVGTLLLMLPAARAGSGPGAGLVTALFASTSAVCVTGLTTVDTATYWSPLGHVLLLALIQVGGFGIMALATLLGLLVSRRMGLRARLVTAAETRSLGIGDVSRVLVGIARTMLLFELAGVAVLWPALVGHGEPVGRALWLAVFHAVSAFNNAGFVLFADGMLGFATDPFVSGTITVLVIAGGLGFPVLFELRRAWRRPGRWTLHTKMVLTLSAVLLAVGTVGFLLLEWTSSLARMSVPGKLVAGFFQGVQPRSGGFNSVDTASLNHETWLFTDILMFIGGGPGSTAGGIKVTTFAVLLFVILAEVRGDQDVNAFDRQISPQTQRQALSLALLAVVVVVTSTGAMLLMTDFTLDRVLFEVISASATVGLSTGVAAESGPLGQLLLAALMFLGRLGPITLASALALRSRPRLYDLPRERPIIG